MFFGPNFGSVERKPERTWVEGSGPHVAGITWCLGYKDNHNSLCIPTDASPEMRDMLLWAYERGFHDGTHRGADDAKFQMRKALGIT